MTEEKWLACADPQAMLLFLRGKASDRKLRLFACACYRSIWHALPQINSRNAVEVAERFADGRTDSDDLGSAEAAAYRDYLTSDSNLAPYVVAVADAALAAECAWRAVRESPIPFLRDIIGNPFRPVAVDPVWLTSTVVALAGGIYDERAFDRMPILADALQDAGCDNDDVLNDCRCEGPHVRGCWVVDLVLGKE